MHPDCASAMTQRLKELYPALTAGQLDLFHRGFEQLDADVRLVKEVIDRNFLGRGEFSWQGLLDIVKWESDKLSIGAHKHDADAPPISMGDARLLQGLSDIDLESHKAAILDANPEMRSFFARSDPRTSPVLRAKILERLRAANEPKSAAP
jgi:hypothetical protein